MSHFQVGEVLFQTKRLKCPSETGTSHILDLLCDRLPHLIAHLRHVVGVKNVRFRLSSIETYVHGLKFESFGRGMWNVGNEVQGVECGGGYHEYEEA